MLARLQKIKEWLTALPCKATLDREQKVLVVSLHEAILMIEARQYADEWLYLFTAPVSFYTRLTPELMRLLLSNSQHLHIGTPRVEEEGLYLRHTLFEDELNPQTLLKVVGNLAIASQNLTAHIISAFGGISPIEYFSRQR
ncbi:MAG: hypothetical protein N2045_02150 [Fimbriimonadales bacterium]|jgi:hypothetical protein|nr:hypothetical protein [Fimbriimonadales bacterium]GBC90797.1 hypothetical protein HRbin14_01552 [bacterium HR14]CUU05796.1 hypothetical protein GBSOP10_10449 [Armatimonadetes bacterium GBS]CUU36122.1 hypothetical protein GXSOP10_122151 [Armatimonadetes bacterium GXS]